MIDDRQFVLGPEPYVESGWTNVTLDGGLVLSYQNLLEVHVAPRNGIALLGHAWQSDPERLSPVEEIARLAADLESVSPNSAQYSAGYGGRSVHELVLEMEKTWCGRYVLICNGVIYLDASGLLGVFHTSGIVSSSLHVLCNFLKRRPVYPKMKRGVQPDFVFGTQTPYEGIYRLLPSQIYDCRNDRVSLRKILPDDAISYRSDSERMEAFIRYFTHSLTQMSVHFKGQRLLLALTGGHDSRTLMALLEKAGVAYDTFTLEHPGISKEDCNYPSDLACLCGKGHHFCTRDPHRFSQKDRDDYQVHTSGMSVDADWDMYAHGQYQQLRSLYDTSSAQDIESSPQDIVILRSGIWEECTDFYHISGKDRPLTEIFPLIRYDEAASRFAGDWESAVRDDRQNSTYSREERVYLDLRLGCWLSSVEQGFDLMDGITSVQPCNCRLLKSILRSWNLGQRTSKQHQEAIVAAACPMLAEPPYEHRSGKSKAAVLSHLLDVRSVYGTGKMLRYLSARLKDVFVHKSSNC